MKRNSELVSIIMPTFNQAKYLVESIDSVRSQSYANWELIVIDNFSTDRTQEFVERYNDSRIKYVKFKNFGIIAASRNFGLANSSGNIVAFLDSDDLWEPRKLEYAVDVLNSDFDFVCTNIACFRDHETPVTLNGFNPEEVQSNPFDFVLERENFVSTSTVVARRLTLIPGFDVSPEFRTAEDLDLWLRTFSGGLTRCFYSREPLTRYRLHQSSASSNLSAHLEACLAVLSKWQTIRNVPIERIRSRNSKVVYYIARKLQQQGKKLHSISILVRSIKLDITNGKAWAGIFLGIFSFDTQIKILAFCKLVKSRVFFL